MEIVNIPIVDFYKFCLESAYIKGFKWVMCFVAREADSEEEYRHIEKYWYSLHDLTGKDILFVFAGNLGYENRMSSFVCHERQTYRGIYNNSLRFMNKYNLTLPEDIYPNVKSYVYNFDEIVKKQTCSITELKKFLGLTERKIPALVFTPTHKLLRDRHIVVEMKHRDLYSQIKEIMELVEHTLEDFADIQDRCRLAENGLENIKEQVERINQDTSVQKRYNNAKKQLKQIINTTDSDRVKRSLEKAIKYHSVYDWHMFDHQTRAFLNQYIDLISKYPELESENEKKELKLKKIEKERKEYLSELEQLHNKEIDSYMYFEKIMNKFWNKDILKEVSINTRNERRFKVAFSFPGEYRDLVGKIAKKVASKFSEDKVLYDYYHRGEFARPNLDIYLQKLYATESELIVIFICSEYDKKKWCGIEWRAIRELLNSKEADDRIIFIKCGKGTIDGIFDTVDGYIDAEEVSVDEIVSIILLRYNLICNK